MQRTHRPTSHKKDPMKQYQGAVSRAQGKHFEEYIDLSLRYYEQRGEAVVEKTPEPMRPTKDLGNGKFIAYYEKAAQPDYKGTLKGGRAVVFEAKHTDDDRIEYNRLTKERHPRAGRPAGRPPRRRGHVLRRRRLRQRRRLPHPLGGLARHEDALRAQVRHPGGA